MRYGPGMDVSEYARIHAHESTHFWYKGLHRLVRTMVDREIARMQKTGAARMLDAGCGTGGVLADLGKRAEAFGFDIAREALEFCRGRGLTRLIRGSVSRIPFADAAFDGVVSLDVLYHRAVVDDQVALAEMARVVRPGGFIILNLPAHDWLRGAHDVVIHTARRYTKARIRDLARGAGVEVARLSYYNAALFPAVVLLRSLVRRPKEAASDVRPAPKLVNAVLSFVLGCEAAVIPHCSLPFGLSLFVVLRKPSSGN